MKKLLIFSLLLLPLVHSEEVSTCGCYHHSEAGLHAKSVLVATVTGCRCAPRPRSTFLETTFALQVESVEKGQLDGLKHVLCPGGVSETSMQQDARTIRLNPGKRYRLFLGEENNILAAQALDDPDEGESGGTGSTTPSGYLEGGTGIPARFTIPDQGRPIHYLVDTDALPSGISQAQALQAVADALAAWSGATELSFVFDGVSSFGAAAPDVVHNKDQRIYIQLHDLYNEINVSTTLGIGGRGVTIPSYASAGGGGGTLDGEAFHQTSYAYVVMHHTSSSNENLTTFTEVLTHEIGHALGLAHSSITPGESDSVKAEAMMYYTSHGDGRGATLGTYDTACIRAGYPNTGFVPFAVDRTIFGTDTTVTPGVSQIGLLPRDLGNPTASLTVQLESASSTNGSFSLAGQALTFTMSGNFNEFSLTDGEILGGTFYDRAVFRVSDGTFLSPYYVVRIIGNIDPPASASLVTPALTVDSDFDLSWTTELYKTYEVQTSQDGVNWVTNQLSWSTATSAASSSFFDPDLDTRLVRVIAWP